MNMQGCLSRRATNEFFGSIWKLNSRELHARDLLETLEDQRMRASYPKTKQNLQRRINRVRAILTAIKLGKP